MVLQPKPIQVKQYCSRHKMDRGAGERRQLEFNLIAHYTLSSVRKTLWGCLLGPVVALDGVCDPLNAFGPGDYEPL